MMFRPFEKLKLIRALGVHLEAVRMVMVTHRKLNPQHPVNDERAPTRAACAA